MAHSILALAIASSLGAGPMGDEQLQRVLDAFAARRDAMLVRQAAKPYPAEGVWHDADFALAALYRDERLAEANAALVRMHQQHPVDPDPERKPTDPEVQDFHWYINLLHRIYFLFSSSSRVFPGRLTADAEAALLDVFWHSARQHCKIRYADPERTWWVWGSENHGAMLYSGFWATAHILDAAPAYHGRQYGDGSTPAQMAAAWDAFYKRFARERAGKGLMVEIGSTYNKYTLQGWYNMADFATDPVLRRRMKMLLDLFWADWAIEQIDAVRGGGKHRIYPGRGSTRGLFSSAQGMAWYYFGLGQPRSQHPSHMCAATSAYRPPLCVVDMALDVQGRGVYEYISRRPGLNLLPKPEQAAWDTYVLRPGEGGVLRYTYATPDFVMGTSMVEPRSHEQWSAISSQNRWDGVIFAGHPDARIFAQPLKPKRGSVYNSHWSIQHKGVLILQKLRTHRHAHGQRIWFSAALTRSEAGGWVFAEAPSAYAACCVTAGATRWEDASKADAAPGAWLVCEDPFAAIILEVVRRGDVADLAAFKASIAGSPVTLERGTLRYRSQVYRDAFIFYTDSDKMPEFNGQPVDMRPSKVYDSPYIESEWDSGVVVLEKAGRRVVLDFDAE